MEFGRWRGPINCNGLWFRALARRSPLQHAQHSRLAPAVVMLADAFEHEAS